MNSNNSSDDLANRAYTIIKEKIIKGEFEQGEVVNITKIAKQLDMSRTPITYAVKKLESESIVKIIPKLGVQIKVVSFVDIKNTYELRAALETYAAKKAIDSITPEQIDLLRNIFRKQLDHINNHDSEKFWEEDKKFHMAIVKFLGNSLMEKAIKDIFDKSVFMRSDTFSEKHEDSISAHKKIIECFASKDKDGLAYTLEQHIMMVRIL